MEVPIPLQVPKLVAPCQDSFGKALQEKMGGLHQNLQTKLARQGSAAPPQLPHLTTPSQWLWGPAYSRGWVDKSHGTRVHCCSRAECLSTMPPGEVRAVCWATAGVPRICPVPAAPPPPPSLRSFDAAPKIHSLAWLHLVPFPETPETEGHLRSPSGAMVCSMPQPLGRCCAPPASFARIYSLSMAGRMAK